MFVMLSVRTTSVCERHNKVTTATTTTANTTTTTTSKLTNAQIIQTTTQTQDHSAVPSSLTTTFDNLLINKNSIEKIFTKSVSFDKNINQSNLSLAQPNNLKEPLAQQVRYIPTFTHAFTNAFRFIYYLIRLYFYYYLFTRIFALLIPLAKLNGKDTV